MISNVTVTEERKAKFDFSTYRQDQIGFYVRTDSLIRQIAESKDIAGLRIITDAGTNQEKILSFRVGPAERCAWAQAGFRAVLRRRCGEVGGVAVGARGRDLERECRACLRCRETR